MWMRSHGRCALGMQSAAAGSHLVCADIPMKHFQPQLCNYWPLRDVLSPYGRLDKVVLGRVSLFPHWQSVLYLVDEASWLAASLLDAVRASERALHTDIAEY